MDQQSADHGRVGWVERHTPWQYTDANCRSEGMGGAFSLFQAERFRLCGRGLEPASVGAACSQARQDGGTFVFGAGLKSNGATNSRRSTIAAAQGDLLPAAA